MEGFDANQVLTTPKGHAIPDALFHSPEDKMAFALILQAQKNILLYRDNPFYADKQQTLYDHVMQLMDTFLELPSVKTILAQGRDADPRLYDTVIRSGRQVLLHDNGETVNEGLSFHQKIKYPDLVEDVKKLEPVAASSVYQIALSHVYAGKAEKFFGKITPLQNRFAKKLQNLTKRERHQSFFRTITQSLIEKLHQEVKDACELIPAEKVEEADTLIMQYNSDYEDCEITSENSVSASLVKTLDKNDGEYFENARLRYLNPEMKSVTLDRESNETSIKTFQRSEKPLVQFSKLDKSLAAAFEKDLNALVKHKMYFYALLGRPYIFIDGTLPLEPSPDAPRSEYLMFLENQQTLHASNRNNGTHPLNDHKVMSNLELAAKIDTMDICGLFLSHSILSNDFLYSSDFKDIFDEKLTALEKTSPIEKHANYVLS